MGKSSKILRAGSEPVWARIDASLKGKLGRREWKRVDNGAIASGLFLAEGCAYAQKPCVVCGKALNFGRLAPLDVPGSNGLKLELAHLRCGIEEHIRRMTEWTRQETTREELRGACEAIAAGLRACAAPAAAIVIESWTKAEQTD
jgi:hypothetical protein